MDLFNFLIPKELQVNKRIKRSARLIVSVDLMILLCAIILVPVFHFIQFELGIYTMYYSICLAILFPIIINITKKLQLAGYFFCFSSLSVFILLTIGTGGMNSPFLIWFITIPPIAFFYFKERDAKVWTSITIIAIGGIFMADIWFGIPNQLAEKWTPYFSLMNLGMILWLFVTVIRSFNTSFKRIKVKIEKSNESLKQSNDELERFAYVASHDLKSPLRNISSFAGLLRMHFKDHIDPNSEQYFSFIERSTQQMKQLIEDILNYSKTNNLKLQREELDLNEIIDAIKEQIKISNGDNYIEIHSTKLPIIKSDQTRVHQLFQNLIENGLKYNESKIPTVTVLCRDKKEMFHLIFEDNGIGIETKYKDQIFDVFERLHTRDKYPGTGIGLATCKKIVNTLGGEIWVESVVGKGSQFHVTFPKNIEIESEELTIEKEGVLEPV